MIFFFQHNSYELFHYKDGYAAGFNIFYSIYIIITTYLFTTIYNEYINVSHTLPPINSNSTNLTFIGYDNNVIE